MRNFSTIFHDHNKEQTYEVTAQILQTHNQTLFLQKGVVDIGNLKFMVKIYNGILSQNLLKFYLFITDIVSYSCMYVCMQMCSNVYVQPRRGHQKPQSWNYRVCQPRLIILLLISRFQSSYQCFYQHSHHSFPNPICIVDCVLYLAQHVCV